MNTNEHTKPETSNVVGGRLERLVMPHDHYSQYAKQLRPLLNFVKAHPGYTAHGLKKKLKEKADEAWAERRELYKDPETGESVPRVHVVWMLKYMELDGAVIRDGNKWYAA